MKLLNLFYSVNYYFFFTQGTLDKSLLSLCNLLYFYSLWLQLTVIARDGGMPQSLQSGNFATVTIRVNRNNNPPVFQNLPTIKSVPHNSSSGFVVMDVDAVDTDNV